MPQSEPWDPPLIMIVAAAVCALAILAAALGGGALARWRARRYARRREVCLERLRASLLARAAQSRGTRDNDGEDRMPDRPADLPRSPDQGLPPAVEKEDGPDSRVSPAWPKAAPMAPSDSSPGSGLHPRPSGPPAAPPPRDPPAERVEHQARQPLGIERGALGVRDRGSRLLIAVDQAAERSREGSERDGPGRQFDAHSIVEVGIPTVG